MVLSLHTLPLHLGSYHLHHTFRCVSCHRKEIYPRKICQIGKKKGFYNTLLSSTIHALIASSGTGYLLLTGGLGNNPVYSKSPIGFAVMQISLGYVLADFVVCLLDKNFRKDFGSLAHHIAGIISIALGLFYQGKFMFFIIFRLLSELSTPLVNLFWILTMLDRRDSPLFAITSWGMLITFFLYRLAPEYWIWNVLLTALFHPASVIVPVLIRVWVFFNYIAFDILNIFWFWKMLKGAAKQIRKLAKRS